MLLKSGSIYRNSMWRLLEQAIKFKESDAHRSETI